MQKPIVNIHQAYFFAGALVGIVKDYPDDHQAFPGAVTNGKEVRTSQIVKHDGNIVETQRTIYHVNSWLTDSAN